MPDVATMHQPIRLDARKNEMASNRAVSDTKTNVLKGEHIRLTIYYKTSYYLARTQAIKGCMFIY